MGKRNKVHSDFNIIAKNSTTPHTEPEYEFWKQFTIRSAQMIRKFPTLNAERRHLSSGLSGSWQITGPYAGIVEFEDLVVAGARHLGFHGGRAMAVQFFLDHMYGDHVINKSQQKRREDQRTAKVTLSDGSLEVFRGRQRLG